MTKIYSSPAGFKTALEQRLRTATKDGSAFARKRQLLVFDRFLARVVAVLGDAATLKGGLVLELRLERARTTRDVALRVVGSPDEIHSLSLGLDEVSSVSLRDQYGTAFDHLTSLRL